MVLHQVDVDLPKLLLVKFFSETLGMRYAGESGWVLLFDEGLNRVAVGVYLAEVYEEAEMYKRVGELLGLGASKIFLAVLPEAMPFVDPRYFKSQGLGLVVVDPSKGPEGVEIKIFAKPRPTPQADLGRADAVRTALMEYVNSQLKKLEETLYEKLKRYVDQRLEEIKRRETTPESPRAEPQPAAPSSVAENEWVRILRSRGRGGS
ncbi:hypothetical protein [Pyrobaculum neutrophilum]|uniref:hypothetical protein n=1 Tax=Pyrobaculum neutrophilum TaxID=70771 RepID=UPI002478C5E9|nr:hypothetical protein [Pyrobaculum neutrophilum]